MSTWCGPRARGPLECAWDSWLAKDPVGALVVFFYGLYLAVLGLVLQPRIVGATNLAVARLTAAGDNAIGHGGWAVGTLWIAAAMCTVVIGLTGAPAAAFLIARCAVLGLPGPVGMGFGGLWFVVGAWVAEFTAPTLFGNPGGLRWPSLTALGALGVAGLMLRWVVPAVLARGSADGGSSLAAGGVRGRGWVG